MNTEQYLTAELRKLEARALWLKGVIVLASFAIAMCLAMIYVEGMTNNWGWGLFIAVLAGLNIYNLTSMCKLLDENKSTQEGLKVALRLARSTPWNGPIYEAKANEQMLGSDLG